MDKLDKWLKKISCRVIVSQSSESRYYAIGSTIIRVSGHIANNSDGDFTIIIDRNNNYLLYNPTSKSIHVISYNEVKLFIKSIILCFETFSVGNPRLHQQLYVDNANLQRENAKLSKHIQSLEKMLVGIPSHENVKLSEIDPSHRRLFIHRLTKNQRQRIRAIFRLSSLKELTDSQLESIFTFSEFQTWIIP